MALTEEGGVNGKGKERYVLNGIIKLIDGEVSIILAYHQNQVVLLL